MKDRAGLGFQLVSVVVAGHARQAARFVCAECRGEMDVTIKGGEPLNPEALANTAKRRGWQAYAGVRGTTLCPACLAAAPPKNDVNSELKKVKPMATTPPTSLTAPASPTLTLAVTPDQKQRIRNYLDKHFDDQVGAYLDDMSDQRIAELVGVPRLAVTNLREAAYGPIRVDPEMAAIRQEMAALKAEVEAAKDHVAKVEKQILATASRLEKLLAPRAVA